MKPLTMLLLAAAFLPALSFAQPSNRMERKASEMIKADDDSDAAYAQLTDEERALVLAATAKKLREVRLHNILHPFGRRQEVKGIDVDVIVDDVDLQELRKKHRAELARHQVISSQETRTEATREPKVVALPPDYEEVHTEPFHGLFDDNKWEILPDSDDAEDLRGLMDTALEKAKNGGKIVGLTIFASASTLYNTKEAKDLTWLQLSDRRAKSALKYILGYLNGKGVMLDQSQVTIKPVGFNGDGTSGPKAPVVNGVQIGGNGNGEPAYADRAEYDQHKFVDVYFLVEVPSPGEEIVYVDKPGTEKSRIVAAAVDVRQEPKTVKPRNRRHFRHSHPPKVKRKSAKGKHKALPCPGERTGILRIILGRYKKGGF